MFRFNNINFFQNINALTFSNKSFYLIRRPRRKPTLYDQERVAYKKVLHEFRLKNIKEYWERQTEVENKFIDKYNKEQEEKKLRDLTKFRSSVVRISYGLKRNLTNQEELDKERKASLQKWIQDEQNKKANRMRILRLLSLESQDWFNEENLEQKMRDKVLIPEFVYDQTDYYLRLQEQTMYLENAEFDKLEELVNERKFIKYKNQKLIPLYGDIVALIKHLKNTEDQQIEKEFHVAKSLLAKQLGKDSKAYAEKLQVIENAYQELLVKLKEVSAQLPNRLDILERNLVILYNLLTKWEEYMTLMKMSNSLVETLISEERKEEFNFKSPDEIREKLQTYTDALMSTQERYTSDSEEEIDLGNQNKKDDKKHEELKQNIKEFMKSETDKDGNIKEDADSEAYKKVDEIFNAITDSKEEEKLLEEKFDDLSLKTNNQFQMLYGGENSNVADVNDLLKTTNIHELFPKSELEKMQDFFLPKLTFQTMDQIVQHEKGKEIHNKDNTNQLLNSAIVEIYKNELSALENSSKLSKKEKNKIVQLQRLLSYIAEIPLDEPKMLMKLWEVYSPSYAK